MKSILVEKNPTGNMHCILDEALDVIILGVAGIPVG